MFLVAAGTVSLHVYAHFPTDINFSQAEGKAIKLVAAYVAPEPAAHHLSRFVMTRYAIQREL